MTCHALPLQTNSNLKNLQDGNEVVFLRNDKEDLKSQLQSAQQDLQAKAELIGKLKFELEQLKRQVNDVKVKFTMRNGRLVAVEDDDGFQGPVTSHRGGDGGRGVGGDGGRGFAAGGGGGGGRAVGVGGGGGSGRGAAAAAAGGKGGPGGGESGLTADTSGSDIDL